MKKDLREKLIKRKIKKPNRFLMAVFMLVFGVINRIYKVDYSYDYEPKDLEGSPIILLSSHASRNEYIYTVYGFGRKDINMVCGFQNIIQKNVYHILLKLGVISKYLYQPDFTSVKHMLGVLHHGGTIGLFPEGIQSTSGSTHPINPATTQFIKRSKANIVVCTTKGAYLATNRYSSDRKKGYIGVEYSLLFTPEMLEVLSEEEIYSMLLDKISYNDFEFNKKARHKYIGKKSNAYGITNILYKCPNCKREHTLCVENDTVVCHSCGFRARINEYYDLIAVSGNNCPEDIDKWYKWQRRCVKEEIADDSFEMSMSGKICTIRLDKLKKAPKNRRTLSVGNARLTKQGLTFTGELDGERVDFDFPSKSLYSLTFSTKGFLEFYYNNEYYMLIPDNKESCMIKWTLAAEEIHNLYDERWKAACDDVYEYSKGEIYG